MSIDELRLARYPSPFRPFRIRMADGNEFRASRAGHIAWDARSRTAICRSGRTGDVIDVDRITSLEYEGAKRK
jgi:hypothetical protein